MYKSSGSKRLSLRLAWTDENFKSNLDSLTLLWKTAYLEDEVHEEIIRDILSYIGRLYDSGRGKEGRNIYKVISDLEAISFDEKAIFQLTHLQLVAQFKVISRQITVSEDIDSLKAIKKEISDYTSRYDSLLRSLQSLAHNQTVYNNMLAAKDKNLTGLNAYLETKKNELAALREAAAEPSVRKKRKRAADLQSAYSSPTQAQPALFSATGSSGYSQMAKKVLKSNLIKSMWEKSQKVDVSCDSRRDINFLCFYETRLDLQKLEGSSLTGGDYSVLDGVNSNLEEVTLTPYPEKQLNHLKGAPDSLWLDNEGSPRCEDAVGLLVESCFTRGYNLDNDSSRMIAESYLSQAALDLSMRGCGFFSQGEQHHGSPRINQKPENQEEFNLQPGCSHWR